MKHPIENRRLQTQNISSKLISEVLYPIEASEIASMAVLEEISEKNMPANDHLNSSKSAKLLPIFGSYFRSLYWIQNLRN